MLIHLILFVLGFSSECLSGFVEYESRGTEYDISHWRNDYSPEILDRYNKLERLSPRDIHFILKVLDTKNNTIEKDEIICKMTHIDFSQLNNDEINKKNLIDICCLNQPIIYKLIIHYDRIN